jgi:hypothetical protein
MIKQKVPGKFDINFLLVIANVLVCGACIYLYNITDNSTVVNVYTIVLVGFLAMENIGMLVYEKRKRNPFIIILILVVTVFYMARVATILHIPASLSLWDSLFIPSSADLNNTLIFILLANAAMFSGFYFTGEYYEHQKKTIYEEDNSPQVKNTIIIIAIAVLVNFFNVLKFASFGSLVGYVQSFLNLHIFLLFVITMMAYHYNKISLRIRTLFIVIFLAITILITLAGSRSGILTVGILLLMGILAVKQKITVSKKIILSCLLIIPISIIFFSIATFKQQRLIKETITIEHLRIAKEVDLFNINGIINYLPLIYYRLGFLDYSMELIANRHKFAQIINGQYYAQSIVDNVLTPGFDVFGIPRASHALSYIGRGEPIPNVEQIYMAYRSDQMGIYGEYYVFFNGYTALAAFFFMAIIFQTIFVNLHATNGLLACLYRAVILYLFYIWLNSFGLDWFIFDVMTVVITTYIFARFYVSKRKRKIVFRTEPKKDGDSVAFST